MLHHDDVHARLVLQHGANHLGGAQTLLHIQVGGRLVVHVHVRLGDGGHCDRETLQLAARQLVDVAAQEMIQLELVAHALQHAALVARLEELAHLPAEVLRNEIDVLDLHLRHQVVHEDALQVVLQVAAAVVLQNVLPVGGIQEVAEIGLQLAGENLAVTAHYKKHLQRRRLADTVGSDEAWGVYAQCTAGRLTCAI